MNSRSSSGVSVLKILRREEKKMEEKGRFVCFSRERGESETREKCVRINELQS